MADSQNRVYVIWRAALAKSWPTTSDPAGTNSNLWFRELEGGKWSLAIPVSETCDPSTQPNAAMSFFAAVDAAGRAQVIWNALPDKWHPELLVRNIHMD